MTCGNSQTARPRPCPYARYPLVQLDGDGRRLGVVAEAVFTEPAADAGLLDSATGSRGVAHVVAIRPNRAGANAVRTCVGFRDVLRPDRGGEAVDVLVGALDNFVNVLK